MILWFGLGFLFGIITGFLLYVSWHYKPYLPQDLIYVGWIPGRPEDREVLRELGVLGDMSFWDEKTAYGFGYFSHCKATWKTLHKLMEWGLPNPMSFTALDKHSNQVPREFQYAWGLDRKVQRNVD